VTHYRMTNKRLSDYGLPSAFKVGDSLTMISGAEEATTHTLVNLLRESAGILLDWEDCEYDIAHELGRRISKILCEIKEAEQ